MSTEKTSSPTRLMKIVMAVSAALALAGGGFFFLATSQKPTQHKTQVHKISVNAISCNPAQLTVPSGQNHFEITNTSDRPIEWEILDGVMVIDERENIAPGFNVSFTTRLRPGSYAITCGLLTNPRGTLTVLPSAPDEPKVKLQPTAFLGPLAEYKLRLMRSAATLTKQATGLQQAIAAHDLAQSQQAYQEMRLTYKKIEAVMTNFADSEALIDPQAIYLSNREQDAAFMGFHAIEYGLYARQTTEGLAPLSAQLVKHVTDLEARIKTTPFNPGDILNQSAKHASLLAGNLAHGESPYAHLDGVELSAAVSALYGTSQLLHPLVLETDPALAQIINNDFVALNQQLEPFAQALAGALGTPLSAAEKTELHDRLMKLSGDLDQANLKLGAE